MLTAASRDLLSACINTSLSTAQLADICAVEDEVSMLLVALSLISQMPLVFLLNS